MHSEPMNSPGIRAVASPRLVVIAFAVFAAFAQAQEPSTFRAGLDNQLGLTFSPDGRTAFWEEWDGEWGSRVTGQRFIYTARSKNGVWSEPEPASFTEDYSDDSPFVSPDGLWLYFVSDRPA